MKPVDLRSDTVTRPTPAMRRAIAEAEVDDDVIGVDPTVDRLQRRTAEVLGKEAAIFMPSGTMTNQVAVRIHCKPGGEFLCEAGCHIYNYEQGAFAQLSGVVARTVEGRFGVLEKEQLTGLIRGHNEHLVQTQMVCLENTHNRGAGRIQPYQTVADICQWARDAKLATHLDGARLFNAVVGSGVAADQWSQHFDTVSVCFSKGLGAPVGSALAGPRDLIDEARWHRKLFGGAMRQAGVLAAGALYALEQHVDRLAEDHEHARMIGAGIRQTEGLRLEPEEIDTNIVIFRVDPQLGSAAAMVEQLESLGVRMMPFSDVHVRAVTHHDVDRAQVQRAVELIPQAVDALKRAG